MEKFFFALVILVFLKPAQGNDFLNIAVASNFNSTLEKISFQYEKKKEIEDQYYLGFQRHPFRSDRKWSAL